MKNVLRNSMLSAVLVLATLSTHAQEALSKNYKKEVVNKLSELIVERYVFEDVALETEKHLKKQLKKGRFNELTTNEDFAKALTETVQEINHDKHMRVRAEKQYEEPENTIDYQIAKRIDQLNRSWWYNGGFIETKVIKGNVGYIKLGGFAPFYMYQDYTDAYMKLIANTDAVIVDLTANGGGDPNMVQYLCSFFFDDKRHLNSLYFREGDITEEFWTLEEVNGKKMPNVPLFVMTSKRTFSGAEEFSYNMQTQKRATLVGQTTGGGANPGGTMMINPNLSVFIPGGTAINPITKTNWEGVGVKPEIETSVEETYDKTLALALAAAEKHRENKASEYKRLLTHLYEVLENYEGTASDEALNEALTACIDAELLDEGEINMMGYEHLMNLQQPFTAEGIFKANIKLYPNSANTYDSYAEANLMNGKTDIAIEFYEKAVQVAKDNNSPDAEMFQRNLDNAKEKAGK
ncbi:MAG: S41 family peptidase [Schleiferiaceae bacterium]|nr:S41 family peptidase [Schleiferiaceae bacterium]